MSIVNLIKVAEMINTVKLENFKFLNIKSLD